MKLVLTLEGYKCPTCGELEDLRIIEADFDAFMCTKSPDITGPTDSPVLAASEEEDHESEG